MLHQGILPGEEVHCQWATYRSVQGLFRRVSLQHNQQKIDFQQKFALLHERMHQGARHDPLGVLSRIQVNQ